MDSKNYQDHFFRKAKTKGYRSRSAFKLIELDEKFKFLKNGINLLDVGSSPGGWCQVAKEKVKSGKILGIDKKKNRRNKRSKVSCWRFFRQRIKNNYSRIFSIEHRRYSFRYGP